MSLSPSARTTLRRHPERASSERDALHALLDACLVVHVAVPGTDGPRVLPMAFGRIGDRLYLHGAVANALLRDGRAAAVCVCATRVDGLVVAKSAFHHSMNYRSAVIFGALSVVEGDEARRALEAIVDHALPGRSRECRAPTESEQKATRVVALDLHEASVKVRAGAPRDAESDLALPHWSGVLPLSQHAAAPIAEDDAELPRSVVHAVLARAPRLSGSSNRSSAARHVSVAARRANHGRLDANSAPLDDVTLSGDPTRLDLPTVLGWLRDDTYWATDLDLPRLLRSIQGSFVVGAYVGGRQVGFARAVTDGETFGWLADVYVAPDLRGRGLGRSLARFLVEHPDLSRLRRWMLGTRDAHALYRPLGFTDLPEGRFLARPR